MVNIIVATSKNRVIGNDNSLIWNLPNDLKHFKKLTTDNSIVMGRKTYESIGRPLPNRRNIIITRQDDYEVDDCEVVNSLEEALLLCGYNCFIIGGGEIYKQSMNIADKIYLTLIDEEFEGDTYFPEIGDGWVEVIRENKEQDDKNEYNYSFIEYERYKF
jgi:dihydrofolate reductase